MAGFLEGWRCQVCATLQRRAPAEKGGAGLLQERQEEVGETSGSFRVLQLFLCDSSFGHKVGKEGRSAWKGKAH